MNKRIKQLAEQATIAVEIRPGTGACEMEKYNQKFVELILEDIVDIIKDTKTYNRCTYTTHDLSQAQCVGEEIIKKINDQLGTKQ